MRKYVCMVGEGGGSCPEIKLEILKLNVSFCSFIPGHLAVPSSRSMTFKKDVSNPGCLRNNVIEQIEQATLISCGGRCLQSADCSSINYYPHRERCDLNSATKAEASDSDFIEFFKCEYYDILS